MTIAIAAVFLATAATVAAPPSNPIVGTWKWNPVEGACPELHTYRDDGTAASTSGDEVLQKTYVIAPASGGMYRVTATVVATNGGKDCLGSTTEVGASSTVYVQLLNDGSYFTCASEQGMSCFGTASRHKD